MICAITGAKKQDKYIEGSRLTSKDMGESSDNTEMHEGENVTKIHANWCCGKLWVFRKEYTDQILMIDLSMKYKTFLILSFFLSDKDNLAPLEFVTNYKKGEGFLA